MGVSRSGQVSQQSEIQENKMEGEGPENTVLKVVIIGDGAVGKTALMVRYRDGRFPSDYIPTVFEMNAKTVEVDNEKFELRLWDTAGQEAYEELRKQAYIGADVIIIGFCLVNRDSFENVTEIWQKDYAKEAKEAKVVLVGLKQDLVEDANEVQLGYFDILDILDILDTFDILIYCIFGIY